MKKFLICLSLLFCFSLAAEVILGEVEIGETYNKVTEKYPLLPKWEKTDEVNRPYPAYLSDESPVHLAQSNKMDIIFYLTEDKKVMAIATYFNDKESKASYETSAGLRCGDGPIEINLLYGEPTAVSEYNYKDENKFDTIRKIYYYPNMCIHTKSQEGLPEYVESIVLTNYDMQYVLNKKNEPLKRSTI